VGLRDIIYLERKKEH